MIMKEILLLQIIAQNSKGYFIIKIKDNYYNTVFETIII